MWREMKYVPERYLLSDSIILTFNFGLWLHGDWYSIIIFFSFFFFFEVLWILVFKLQADLSVSSVCLIKCQVLTSTMHDAKVQCGNKENRHAICLHDNYAHRVKSELFAVPCSIFFSPVCGNVTVLKHNTGSDLVIYISCVRPSKFPLNLKTLEFDQHIALASAYQLHKHHCVPDAGRSLAIDCLQLGCWGSRHDVCHAVLDAVTPT